MIDDPILFTPMAVGPLRLKNRLVALPVHTGFAHPDGSVGSWLTDFCARLAGTGVAMVVVANTAVSPDGVVSRFNLRADEDRFIPGLAALADTIKQKGAIACLQLNHAGRFAKTRLPLLPSPMSPANLSFNIESLKGFMEFFPFEKRFRLTREFLRQVKAWRRAMDPEDRERVIEDFARAALRACQAGFDMVELHGANGYLLCQFLSSFTNKLESGFGGDFSGRCAFPLAVIRAVKERLPGNFPLGFRLILREWVPEGIDLPEALAFARLLEKEGVAYLSASAGTFNSIFSRHAARRMGRAAYLKEDAMALTGSVQIPTIISGRITTPSLAQKLIAEGAADLIGLGRPLRCDPEWVAKARDGSRKIRVCINCNACLKRVILEKGFICSRWPGPARERSELEHKLLTRPEKTLWVITGTGDMAAFKHCLPLLTGNSDNSPRPEILFLKEYARDRLFDDAGTDFIQWARDAVKSCGSADEPIIEVMDVPQTGWEDAIDRAVVRGGHGRIFLSAERGGPWSRRMLCKERGKVMALLAPNSRQKRVLVPVDLSDASLLIMVFLKKGYLKAPGFNIDFVHVLTGMPAGQAGKRWKRLKLVAGLDPAVPLRLVPVKTDVVSALAETLRTGGHGTVVMGKRGLSGLKRWLMGSVSSGLSRRLTDQSLLMVD